jgi:hypothetical protein
MNFEKCLKVFYLIGYTFYEKELEEMLRKVCIQPREDDENSSEGE